MCFIVDLIFFHDQINQIKPLTGATPLHGACRGGQDTFVCLLLDNGADVNSKNNDGK